MPRQHVLTEPITADDVLGRSTGYGIVRITRWEENPRERVAIVRWEIGRLDDGAWKASGPKGFKEYRGSDYLELIGNDPQSKRTIGTQGLPLPDRNRRR